MLRTQKIKIKKGHSNFINADVNAALNIILKVIPDAFGIRDIGLVDSPRVLLVA